MFELSPERRAQVKRIEAGAEQVRELARGVPAWQVDQTAGGQVLLIETASGKPVAELVGMWTPSVTDHFNAYHTDTLVTLAELLWRIGGHGGADDIRRMAERFVTAVERRLKGLPAHGGPGASERGL